MIAFVLAGGFATRLWPLTSNRAKPLLPLAGKPILDHLIEKIPPDISITVSTNAAFEQGFKEWQKTHSHRPVEVIIEKTASDDEKLGALGALAQWINDEKINDDLLVLTGDNYLGFSVTDFINKSEKDTALIAAYDIQDIHLASSFGTVITAADGKKVINFEEKPVNPRSTLINTGCCILPDSVLPVLLEYAKIKPDDLGGIFEEILNRRLPLSCYRFSGLWFDIGSFDAYLEATRAVAGNKVLKGKNAVCENCTTFGSVVLGNNCRVTNSQLKNVVLFDNCNIDDCTLENCIIDGNCDLKGLDLEKKMLQAGTTLYL